MYDEDTVALSGCRNPYYRSAMKSTPDYKKKEEDDDRYDARVLKGIPDYSDVP